MSYEKLGDCNNEPVPVKMTANIAGERYEFVTCLSDDFDGKNYSVERKGDTVLVLFPRSRTNPKTYKITLDIDAKPAYHLIMLDNHEVLIVDNKNTNEQN